jgi:hypothetical protein
MPDWNDDDNENERGATGVAFCAQCGFLESVATFIHENFFWKGLLRKARLMKTRSA